MNALAMTRAFNPEEEEVGLTLRELAELLVDHDPVIKGDPEVRVSGVQQDSRRVVPGELFAARSGAKNQGASFAQQALALGARAILTDKTAPLSVSGTSTLRVDGLSTALARAAEAVYGFPSRSLPVIGITGTNGKTTTSFLIEHGLSQLGGRPARLGTLGFSFAGRSYPTEHTTPEADELSRLIARARADRATHFVMEVSSHALEQQRVAALSFEVAAFTNLSRDHLDFHGSMDRYAAAKSRLFTELSPSKAVINLDDPLGRTLAETTAARVTGVARNHPAELQALETSFEATEIRASLRVHRESFPFRSRLLGAHNLENLLVALGTLLALGYPPREAIAALESAASVPGRLERCDTPSDDLLVAVDYAHTPDALERVLKTLRPLTQGRLLCVFGCGGARDPGKRSKMGEVVAQGADSAVITNDNPRTEPPEQIASAVASGFSGTKTPWVIELDRARAIDGAIQRAAPGDVVLIAGKGHESYQIFGTERRPFDDRDEARRALETRRRVRGAR